MKALGKEKMTENAIKHAVFDAEDMLKAIQEIYKAEPVTAVYLLHKKVTELMKSYFDVKGLWTPAPKQILEVLKQVDEELYTLIQEFYKSNKGFDEQLDVARNIVIKVFS